jgi:PAS domain S-box-containing protein
MKASKPESQAGQMKSLQHAGGLHQQIISSVQEGIIVYDLDLRYVVWNPGMEEISGVSALQVVGKHPLEVFPELRGQPLYEQLERALTGETIPVLDVRFRVRDTEKQGWVAVKQTALRDADGKITGVLATVRDVTHAKFAEQVLNEREYLLSESQRIAKIGSWSWDIATNEIRWTQEMHRIYGTEPDTFVISPESFAELIHPEERPAMQAWIDACVAGLEPGELEFRIITPDGTVRFINGKGDLQRDPRGRPFRMIGTAQDVTARKRAEEALRRSEASLEAAQERARLGNWEIDLASRTAFWSHEMFRLYERDPALGAPNFDEFLKLIHPEDRTLLEDLFMRVRRSPEPLSVDYRTNPALGWMRHLNTTMQGVTDDEGRIVQLAGTVLDITERKLADQAVAESENRLRTIVASEPECVKLLGPDGLLLDINPAGLSMIEADSLEQVAGKPMLELVDPLYRAAFGELTKNVFRGESGKLEFEITGLKGAHRWLETHAVPLRNPEGKIAALLGITRDITEHKRAEGELRNSHEQLRALTGHLQSVREEERTLIAREIHDELGQALTGLKMDVASIQTGLRKSEPVDRLIARTGSMSKLIDSTVQTVRRIATQLRPGILDDLGLVAAIEWQAQDFQSRTGVDCRFTSSVEDLHLDRDRSTAAFRILQETLTNVARHSGATAVDVSLKRRDNKLLLDISDNGKGITASEIAGKKSLGLLGIRERAQLVGGEVKIIGTSGKGTAVQLRIPIE